MAMERVIEGLSQAAGPFAAVSDAKQKPEPVKRVKNNLALRKSAGNDNNTDLLHDPAYSRNH